MSSIVAIVFPPIDEILRWKPLVGNEGDPFAFNKIGLIAFFAAFATLALFFVAGKKRALVAVGRSILTIVWHLLSDPDAHFHDLGADFYDTRLGTERARRNHVQHLEALGYKVTLEPAAA